MFWRFWFYCPHCGKILNRFQVAYGTDNVRLYWHRCKHCGTKVDSLKSALQSAIDNSVEYATYRE